MKVIENMEGNSRKGTVIVLLIAVILVWGAVGYYIVRQFLPRKSPDVPLAVQHQIDECQADGADTLSLDYPDPFLKPLRAAAEVNSGAQSSPKPAGARRIEEAPVVPDIVFKGVIGSGKKLEAMVMQNGKMLMLHSGDSLGSFVVVSCSPESLELKSRGKTVRVEAR